MNVADGKVVLIHYTLRDEHGAVPGASESAVSVAYLRDRSLHFSVEVAEVRKATHEEVHAWPRARAGRSRA